MTSASTFCRIRALHVKDHLTFFPSFLFPQTSESPIILHIGNDWKTILGSACSSPQSQNAPTVRDLTTARCGGSAKASTINNSTPPVTSHFFNSPLVFIFRAASNENGRISPTEPLLPHQSRSSRTVQQHRGSRLSFCAPSSTFTTSRLRSLRTGARLSK